VDRRRFGGITAEVGVQYQPFRRRFATSYHIVGEIKRCPNHALKSKTREESLSLCCFARKILEKLTMRSLIDAQHRHILKAANHIHPKLMPKLSAGATFEHYRAIKLGSEVDLRWIRCETRGERAGVCACITRLRTRCSGPAVSIFSLLLFSCLVLLLLIRHGYLLLCILYFVKLTQDEELLWCAACVSGLCEPCSGGAC
jgi:hypothetical protein